MLQIPGDGGAVLRKIGMQPIGAVAVNARCETGGQGEDEQGQDQGLPHKTSKAAEQAFDEARSRDHGLSTKPFTRGGEYTAKARCAQEALQFRAPSHKHMKIKE